MIRLDQIASPIESNACIRDDYEPSATMPVLGGTKETSGDKCDRRD
ncbi:MAG: hypothetical protein LBP59_17585 [Planctomycetaceae bacterium]|nr:hypothetical protein [Planctomycetaceae bacterium]